MQGQRDPDIPPTSLHINVNKRGTDSSSRSRNRTATLADELGILVGVSRLRSEEQERVEVVMESIDDEGAMVGCDLVALASEVRTAVGCHERIADTCICIS